MIAHESFESKHLFPRASIRLFKGFSLRIIHLQILVAVIAVQCAIATWLNLPRAVVVVWFVALAVALFFRRVAWLACLNRKRLEIGERHIVAWCFGMIGVVSLMVCLAGWLAPAFDTGHLLACLLFGAFFAAAVESPFVLSTIIKELRGKRLRKPSENADLLDR